MNFKASEPDGKHRCPHCTALYTVEKWGETPARDSDKEPCHCCGKEMASWNATSYPIFALVDGCPGDKGTGFL